MVVDFITADSAGALLSFALVRWVLAWAPERREKLVDDLGRHAWATLAGYVRGMVVVALFDAVLIGLALFVLGVPLVLSLTLVVFIGASSRSSAPRSAVS